MDKAFIYLLLLIPGGLFCLEPIHSEVTALGYGSATTVTGIDALGFNPAGLGSLKDAAFLINSNGVFSYNYLALGFDLHRYGAVGISLSSISIGDGLGIGWGRWILPGLGCGLKLEFFHAESVWNFNGRLGIIYAYSHRFTMGGWLHHTTEEVTVSRKSREKFILGGKYKLNSSVTLYAGGEFSITNRELDDFGIGIEYFIRSHYRLMVGGGLNSAYAGFAVSFPNDRLGFTSGYDLNQERFQNLLTYIHSLKSPPTVGYISKKVESSKGKKSSSQKKLPKLTQEIRKRQKRYLDLGVEYYRKEKYQQAIEVWQKVVNLYPEDDLAIKAQEYIRGVEEMLKRLEDIKK